MTDHGHDHSHEGHSHDLPVAAAIGDRQTAKEPDKLSTSYRVALDIWIRRFKEAQGAIRELENENERLSDLLEKALELMSDDQLLKLKEAKDGSSQH